MPRKRIAVLYEIWWPKRGDEPPPGAVAADPAPDVHEEVYRALSRLGHAPHYSVLEGDVASLERLARLRTSLVFNLTESYAGDDTKDFHVAAYLEMLGKPFTGCDARALHLGQDKVLQKKLLHFHSIPSPEFAVWPGGLARRPHLPPFPLIVKPSREDGSIGIDAGSVVHDPKALRARVRYVHERFSGPALVERYVEGREIYVAIVGNDPPEALPPVEIDLTMVPDGTPRIAGTEVKWWTGSRLYRDTPPVYPRGFSAKRTRQVQRTALAAYRALGLRDYGRVDLRVPAVGEPQVIEVNPNPWLAPPCELVMAWTKTGRSYDELIARLVDLALARAGKGGG